MLARLALDISYDTLMETVDSRDEESGSSRLSESSASMGGRWASPTLGLRGTTGGTDRSWPNCVDVVTGVVHSVDNTAESGSLQKERCRGRHLCQRRRLRD